MSLLTSIRDRLAGRTPEDAAALAVYRAMMKPPAYVELALDCERVSRDRRATLLASVDDATRAQAVAYMKEPPANRERDRRLAWMRADAAVRVPALLTYYSKNIADFISDNMSTFDPRLASKTVPFELFPKQREMVDAIVAAYRNAEPLSIVKSRDSGASWCGMAVLASLAIFEPGFTAIVGSQLEIKIDAGGNTNTLYHKLRSCLEFLPVEFRGGWDVKTGSKSMLVWFPNGSSIQGEAGEAIGRGGRASMVFLDEYAHVLHSEKIDEALSATSECKIYVSSVNGTGNSFAKRVREGKTKVFYYRWSDDPRKTPEWKAAKILADGQRKFNQEYDCDFNAGNAAQAFKQEWLDAATDAHIKLNLEVTGLCYGGLDLGAGGDDANAFAIVQGGMLIKHVEIWASSPRIYRELEKAIRIADKFGVTRFHGDCVGVGAGIVEDVEQISRGRVAAGLPRVKCDSFKSSEQCTYPDRRYAPGDPQDKSLRKDVLPNRKSEAYDDLGRRLLITFNAVTIPGFRYSKRDIISFDSTNPTHGQLLQELGQIESEYVGQKIYFDKYGSEGEDSPNAADAVAMALSPIRGVTRISQARVDAARKSGPGTFAGTHQQFFTR
jgi:phage terminase large subunit